MMRQTALALSAALCLALTPGGSAAQSLFAPAARVDGAVVTEYEVGQRQRMLQVFGAPDPSAESALDDLVDERLQLAEARRLGIDVTAEQLEEGKSEFAGRANLGTEEFVGRLNEAGVSVEAFEDFVRAGIAWREVVSQRFGGGQTQVEPDVVERAADAPAAPELRVLLNEIILPADTPERARRAEALAPQIAAIGDFGSFAAAAREYSATPSRERGGAIDWLRLSELPPQIGQVLQELSPGEVSQPIQLPNAVAFFQLRELGEVPGGDTPTELEYAVVALPAGSPRAEAGRIAASAATCDALEGVVGAAGGGLERETQPIGQIPSDLRLELARLDPGEVAVIAGGANMVMLCARSYRAAGAEEPDLSAVRGALVNERVERRAANLLAELRANAAIDTE